MTHRVGELELGIEQESARTWLWQRAGWAALGLLLALGVIGLFGGGPIAHGSVDSDDGLLRVDYERFTRFESPATVRVRSAPGAAENGELQLLINGDYFRYANLDHVTPQPKSARAAGSDIAFSFAVDKEASAEIWFAFRATRPGAAELAVHLPQHASLRVHQIVFP